MGRIKDGLEYQDIKNKLVQIGFKWGKGAQGEKGYVKPFYDDVYCLRVTVSFKERKLYLYNEYECGGHLWSENYDIPQDVLKDCHSFIDWLDEKIG